MFQTTNQPWYSQYFPFLFHSNHTFCRSTWGPQVAPSSRLAIAAKPAKKAWQVIAKDGMADLKG
jgi:hypothetical protein